MVYDPGTHQVLLFGGARRMPDGTGRDSTLWSWNGSSWSSQTTALAEPANDAAAYDPERNRLVMHGGSGLGAGVELDETLEWDHHAWQLIRSAGPGARAHHAMVYDAVRKQIVLFGSSDDTPDTDTWGWDGHAWKKLASDGPPARGVYGVAFDTQRGVTVIFGGCCARGVGLLGDTWEWDGQRWTHILTPNAPSPRFDTNMAYDPLRRRVVLFGGRSGNTNVGDTWEYDGRAWTKLNVAGPSPRNGHALVYDPDAKAILLFGGRNEPTYFNDFWAFDGAWRQIPERRAAQSHHDPTLTIVEP